MFSALYLTLRRAILSLPILFGVLLFTFMLVRVGQNDPVGMLAGPTAGALEIEAIRAAYKLDQPIWVQFIEYVKLVLHGDLGNSWLSNRPVPNSPLQFTLCNAHHGHRWRCSVVIGDSLDSPGAKHPDRRGTTDTHWIRRRHTQGGYSSDDRAGQ